MRVLYSSSPQWCTPSKHKRCNLLSRIGYIACMLCKVMQLLPLFLRYSRRTAHWSAYFKYLTWQHCTTACSTPNEHSSFLSRRRKQTANRPDTLPRNNNTRQAAIRSACKQSPAGGLLIRHRKVAADVLGRTVLAAARLLVQRSYGSCQPADLGGRW